MFGIGGGEFIFIIFIALMLFGTDKLPEAARTFGKIMANLKHATNEIKTEIQKSADVQEISESLKQVSASFTAEVDKVKETVAVPKIDLGENVISEAASSISHVKEDIEDIASGPIKRQL